MGCDLAFCFIVPTGDCCKNGSIVDTGDLCKVLLWLHLVLGKLMFTAPLNESNVEIGFLILQYKENRLFLEFVLMETHSKSPLPKGVGRKLIELLCVFIFTGFVFCKICLL